MIHSETKWRTADGTLAYGCAWTPEQDVPIRAVVCLVHGMGEHAGRYGHVAQELTDNGFAVLAFDQRGHGKTEGKRGHVPEYEGLLEGVDWMLSLAAEQYSALPLFLYGHSMGGNVTLNYLLRSKPNLAGAVVTGPWLKLAFQAPPVTVAVGRVVERFFPGYINTRPLNVKSLTSDPEMMQRYVEDPLGHGDISVRFFFSVQRAGLWAIQHANELSVPILLMHGGDDKVTSIEASREFAEGAGGLCEFQEWPAFKHELHNETRRSEVFAAIVDWLEKRIAALT
ncbi:alpha-beta hydrolase superfamily lysophospholipase [Paenibacillus phyllosphaerae]|uniref:Alpha-beta hydrolase superfamily lysophospholipase n=1 Tax=Paenibacillus phyllosphaerae TaxID=274593 RepID=A0A7W5B1R3_9BACL|nr:alpha/beta hydrolase [Paenibacillus phyllosphaerae]MBB3112524.1 alpha-beta hydrolase superfamily lysophospholipase [Paenibacillus phyllosphaerae]